MVLLVFIQVLSRHGNAPSETSTKAETNIENTELNSHNRINLGDSLQDKRIYFKFGMLIFGYVIAKYSMRRGVAPSPFPTAGTTFPLDTLLFNASLFSFPAANCTLKLYCTSAREFTVVPRPVCG